MRLVFLIAFFVSLPTWSAVTSGNCPQEFRGKVKEVIEAIGPEMAFSTNKVIFENQETLKGRVDNVVPIEILSNGPFKVEPGKEYKVQLRNGKLCWIEDV